MTDARVRSGLTLAGLVLVMAVALLWGWRALTEPFPGAVELPVCVDTPVSAGTAVFPDQVAVSVFNASNRNGLASKTLSLLVTRGFVPADTGNAPDDAAVKGVQIWADDPQDPAVALVRQHFRKAKVTTGPELGLGVVVVVGDGFDKLRPAKKSPESVAAESATRICSPPDVLP